MADNPFLVERMRGFGTTIFTEMSALALSTGAINLGQGFPDTDGPPEVIEAAVAALRGAHNQYAPLPGVPALRDAVLEHQHSYYGLEHRGRPVLVGEALAEVDRAGLDGQRRHLGEDRYSEAAQA